MKFVQVTPGHDSVLQGAIFLGKQIIGGGGGGGKRERIIFMEYQCIFNLTAANPW